MKDEDSAILFSLKHLQKMSGKIKGSGKVIPTICADFTDKLCLVRSYKIGLCSKFEMITGQFFAKTGDASDWCVNKA